MLQFIIERANYWAIIGLMMVGLYIAFQSTNLIKKLVGLSIFQTSVFLFYITLGKISGGSAPILYGGDYGAHGGDHGDDAGHGAAGKEAGEHGAAAIDAGHGEAGLHTEAAGHESQSAVQDAPENVVGDTVDAENLLADGPLPSSEIGPETVSEQLYNAGHGAGSVPDGVNPLTGLYEVYSNPLPHVLILTAIVVGVATLSVGLALVVRIREAYGTIESDEVRQLDIETADAQDANSAAGVNA